jgi:putative endonuclease
MSTTESKGYSVYIAELKNGRLYVGITDDLDRRSAEHAAGKRSTRTSEVFGFRRIIYPELHRDRASALKRERQLKAWNHAKKRALASGNILRLKQLARRKKARPSSVE